MTQDYNQNMQLYNPFTVLKLDQLLTILFNEISNLQAEEVIQNVSSKLLEKCSLAGSFEVGILRKGLAGT